MGERISGAGALARSIWASCVRTGAAKHEADSSTVVNSVEVFIARPPLLMRPEGRGKCRAVAVRLTGRGGAAARRKTSDSARAMRHTAGGARKAVTGQPDEICQGARASGNLIMAANDAPRLERMCFFICHMKSST
jgi:hypothetical protein